MSYLLHVLLFPEETNPHPFSFDGFIIFLLSIFYINTFPFYSYFRFLWLTYIDLCESKKSPLMWVLINVFKFPLSLSLGLSHSSLYWKFLGEIWIMINVIIVCTKVYEKKLVLLDALANCQFPLIYSSYINVLGKSAAGLPEIIS